MKLFFFVLKSLFSYKRAVNRSHYWLSILVVFLLLLSGVHIGEHPRFAYAPDWKKYTSLAVMGIGMLLWMSTLASRAYLCQKPRWKSSIAVWFPFLNLIYTILLGVTPATRPGYEEKPNTIEKIIKYTVSTFAIILFIGVVVGGFVSFFESEAFETTKSVVGGVILLLIINYIARSASSSPGDSSPTHKRNISNKKGNTSGDVARSAKKKEVGVYVYKECKNCREQKMWVYSDGNVFTTTSNLKAIEADSFKALEALIYKSYEGFDTEYSKFELVRSKVY